MKKVWMFFSGTVFVKLETKTEAKSVIDTVIYIFGPSVKVFVL